MYPLVVQGFDCRLEMSLATVSTSTWSLSIATPVYNLALPSGSVGLDFDVNDAQFVFGCAAGSDQNYGKAKSTGRLLDDRYVQTCAPTHLHSHTVTESIPRWRCQCPLPLAVDATRPAPVTCGLFPLPPSPLPPVRTLPCRIMVIDKPLFVAVPFGVKRNVIEVTFLGVQVVAPRCAVPIGSPCKVLNPARRLDDSTCIDFGTQIFHDSKVQSTARLRGVCVRDGRCLAR